MNKDQVQLFENDYATRCDTFGCGESGKYFIGRPDAPASTNYTLCEKCSNELMESVVGSVVVLTDDVVTPGTVVITEALYEDLKTSAAAWNEYASQLTVVSDGANESFVTSDAAGFRINADEITLNDIETKIIANSVNDADQNVIDEFAKHLDAELVKSLEQNELKDVNGGVITEEEPKKLIEVDYDIDAKLEAAKTHKDLDEIVEDLVLTNVPDKEDENGKHTMDERKAAILSNFEGDDE